MRRPRRAFRHTRGWRYPAPEEEPLSVTAGQEAPMGYLALGQQGIRRAAGLGRRPPDSCLKTACFPHAAEVLAGYVWLFGAIQEHGRPVDDGRTEPQGHRAATVRPLGRHQHARGLLRTFCVSSQLAERRENGSVLGRCRGTFDAAIASRRRYGARRFAEIGFLSY